MHLPRRCCPHGLRSSPLSNTTLPSLAERLLAAECIEGKHYEVRDNHGELVKHCSMEPRGEYPGRLAGSLAEAFDQPI